MFLEPLFNWVEENFALTLILCAAGLFTSWKLWQESKKRKKAKEDGIRKELQTAEKPTPPDSLYLTPDFANVSLIEESNQDVLHNFLAYVEKQIGEEKLMYAKAKQQHEELLEIGRKLKKHIPKLVEQREAIKKQIQKKEAEKDDF